ncbi:uncharacterized protein si:ch211-157b11.14 [Notolabrus celidotus]|uniref:uncharacterized protein si:ch211-157b11.14 n=1 Tax=Notolabrus celidotus TaxID=1203425 RepID=UPI00149058F3|nr:uncharacterized protein si:ch211-157b11.14 [Notolabrus celidotus]
MDDLDHSIHIGEYDWTSFFEESEECGLLQPLLACLDHTSLSDSEDSRNSSPVFIKGRQEPQQTPDANSDKTESNAAPWCMGEVQINLSSSRKEQDDPSTKAEEDSDTQLSCEIGLDCPTCIEDVHLIWSAVHTTEETNDQITVALQTEHINDCSSLGEAVEQKKDNGVLQTESDTCELKPTLKPDPFSCNQTEVIVNEPHSTDRAEGKDESSVALRAERERWFVTVNDSPARQRVHGSSGKKKRRQKKTKVSHMCRTSKLENSNSFKPEGNRGDDGSKGGGDISDTYPIVEENPERIPVGVNSDLSQMSSTSAEEDNSPEEFTLSHSSREKFTLHDAFIFKGPPRLDSIESEDGAEFFSTHSYDSESYLSAAESIDEPQYLPINNPPLKNSGSLTKNSCMLSLMENTNADNTQVTEIPLSESTLSSNSTAASSEGYECTDVDPTQTFPPVGQSVNTMPDDNSACVNDTPSKLSCISSNPSGVPKHDINLPASACSSGDQLNLLSVPNLTVTSCLSADSPETYAEATGNTRPVYAISAFWDEMEKLTINDILQLRVGRSPPPRDTQETVTRNDDFPTSHSSLDETGEYSLCSGGLTDPDTADSDYSTQADESKPDRSSCEFSTSDFEEEYWQFLGASRNPSPDPQSKMQRTTRDSPYFEEGESTCSEGKETPVPPEDFEEHLFEDLDSKAHNSSELVWPRQITKIKSMHNVLALNTEDLSLQLLLDNDDTSLFLTSCPSLDEDVVLEASDSLGTLMPTTFLSNTQVLNDLSQMSFPEVFENQWTDQTKAARCITYDPEDLSSPPVFDYTPCTLRDEASLYFLHDSQCCHEKPIPIFSCSHPTVRELTFPNPNNVFLSSDYKTANDFSPIRLVSHSFIQGGNVGTSAVAFSGFHSFLSLRKIHFQNKGSIWCGSSGIWVFPVEAADNTIKGEDPPLTVLGKRSVLTPSSQVFRELAVQQGILGTFQSTRREGIFSTLKQSDMCLVCIAFASWVLRSSDPEAADTWKAALLANVSALSAIQYLRQYVKKKPSQEDL